MNTSCNSGFERKPPVPVAFILYKTCKMRSFCRPFLMQTLSRGIASGERGIQFSALKHLLHGAKSSASAAFVANALPRHCVGRARIQFSALKHLLHRAKFSPSAAFVENAFSRGIAFGMARIQFSALKHLPHGAKSSTSAAFVANALPRHCVGRARIQFSALKHLPHGAKFSPSAASFVSRRGASVRPQIGLA